MRRIGEKELLEKMSHEEAERAARLSNKILAVIETEAGFTYQDTIRALESIKKNYENKGQNLLNSLSIREVSRFGGLMG